MSMYFAEHPTRTRIREFDCDQKDEFIADVNVNIEKGNCGMTKKELSWLATKLLVEYLNKLGDS